MKVQVASDLHIEFLEPGTGTSGTGTGTTAVFDGLLTPTAPYLLLAGDIGVPTTAAGRAWLGLFLAHVAARFRHVFYVAGNHEFYNTGRTGDGATYNEVMEALRALCGVHANVTFLDRAGGPAHILADGSVVHGAVARAAAPPAAMVGAVRVIGCTLWSHVPVYAEGAVMSYLNDYRLIVPPMGAVEHTGKLGVHEWLSSEHEADLGYVRSQVVASMAAREPACIVMTHHAPTFHGASHPRYATPLERPTNTAFATSLEYMFATFMAADTSNVALWVYGHTHYNRDDVLYGTRVVANQRGYEHDAHEMEADRPYVAAHAIDVALPPRAP